MALRGSAEGRDFREGLCSAKGNRTPIARMKILSTNRYTMAPRAKSGAKVLLFFELTKKKCKKMQFLRTFLQKQPRKAPFSMLFRVIFS